MNKIYFMYVMEAALLSSDGVSLSEMEVRHGIPLRLAKIGEMVQKQLSRLNLEEIKNA